MAGRKTGYGNAMSRKHFVQIAETLSGIRDKAHREQETDRWIPMLKRENPRFNEARFRRAVEAQASSGGARRGRGGYGNDGPAAAAPAAPAPAQASRYKKRRAGTCSICGGSGHGYKQCPHYGDRKKRVWGKKQQAIRARAQRTRVGSRYRDPKTGQFA